MFYVGYLVVEDRTGGRFVVRKFHGRRFFTPIDRYVLDSGERVESLGSDKFQVSATGKELLRVR
jgi:hypothetical protein